MVESENRIKALNECIRNHYDVTTWLNSCELRQSSDFGCGIYATRDISANELLFSDKPLLLGPTGIKSEPVVCVVCYEKIALDNLATCLCSDRCGLVLCSESACAEQHKIECQLMQTWKPKNPDDFSFIKAKSLIVIRSILLKDQHRKFFDLMQKNYTNLQSELYFNGEFENFPVDKHVVTKLRDASAAINTNTFKILYRVDKGVEINVRAFYPIMSLINHTCSPNARHSINNEFESRVVASRPIKKGEQIFIIYSQLLWATNSRRMHMMVSKQFLCMCKRCTDPTENFTNLSAIRCMDKTCSGVVLPIEPVNFKSNAKCDCCERIHENKQFLRFQDMAASITRIYLDKPFTLVELMHFIETRLHKLVPDCSQFVVEAKLKAISKCSPTNCEEMNIIKHFCEDILRILNKLEMGECSLKGFLAHKLYTIRNKLTECPKLSTDLKSDENMDSDFTIFLNDNEQLWATAKEILMNTSTAPADFVSNKTCLKP